MKKYEIKKNYREVKGMEEIKTGCTLKQEDQEPETLETYEDKEKALEALKKYKSQVDKLTGGAGAYYVVTEYYVEENDYDEDGEWCGGGDVWKFAEFEEEEK